MRVGLEKSWGFENIRIKPISVGGSARKHMWSLVLHEQEVVSAMGVRNP